RASERLLDQYALDVFQTHLVERRGGAPAPSAVQPEVTRLHTPALRHEHGSLDRMIELPHVARPGMAEQHLHGVRRELHCGFAIACGVAVQEMRGEQRDIGAPLAQWGKPDLDRVETEQQIFAEAAGLHLREDLLYRLNTVEI